MAEQKEKIWVSPPMPGGQKIRHVGYLDLGEFYTWMQRWFEFNGYFHDNFERFYEERISPKGKEIHIRWEGRKKETPYFTYVIEVAWLAVGVNDVEIPIGDKKRKIKKGDFELRFGAYLEKKGNVDVFRKIYEYFMVNKLIEEHKVYVYTKFNSLLKDVRGYFDQYVQ